MERASAPGRVVAAAPSCVLTAALPAVAVDLLTLVLAVAGTANGALDIAMNANGLVVERRAGRPLFSSLRERTDASWKARRFRHGSLNTTVERVASTILTSSHHIRVLPGRTRS